MKGFYEAPSMEIIEFLADDIIVTSLSNGGTGTGGEITDGEFEDITGDGFGSGSKWS